MNKQQAKRAALKRRQRRVRGKIFWYPLPVRAFASCVPTPTSTP